MWGFWSWYIILRMNSVHILTSWFFRSTLIIYSHLCSLMVSSLQVFWHVLNAAPVSLSLISHSNRMCDEYKLWASPYTASFGFDLAVWISVVSHLVASILAPYSSDDWSSRFLHNVGDHLRYNSVWSYNPEGGDVNFHIAVCTCLSFQLLPPALDVFYAPYLQHPFRLFFPHSE
jgi:hypothetical protein